MSKIRRKKRKKRKKKKKRKRTTKKDKREKRMKSMMMKTRTLIMHCVILPILFPIVEVKHGKVTRFTERAHLTKRSQHTKKQTRRKTT